MENPSLSELQHKRSKALQSNNMAEYWLFDARVCIYLGEADWALESLQKAIKAEKENAQ
jgi:hypothetical protein